MPPHRSDDAALVIARLDFGGRILEQPQSQGRPKWNVCRVKVEIDVSVAGQRSTYVFNCVHSGQATVIQPLGMR